MKPREANGAYQRPPIEPAGDKAFPVMHVHYYCPRCHTQELVNGTCPDCGYTAYITTTISPAPPRDDHSGHCPNCLEHCEGAWKWCPYCGRGFAANPSVYALTAEVERYKHIANLNNNAQIREENKRLKCIEAAAREYVEERSHPTSEDSVRCFRNLKDSLEGGQG